jgi:hypothetical protein
LTLTRVELPTPRSADLIRNFKDLRGLPKDNRGSSAGGRKQQIRSSSNCVAGIVVAKGAWLMTAISGREQATFAENEMPGKLFCFICRLQAGCITGFGFATLIAIVGLLSNTHAETAQSSAPPRTTVGVVARPCKNILAGSKRQKGTNKNRNKTSGDEGGNSSSTCIEVRSTAIDVQEYLQAQGREEKWNLGDEHVAEDAWTFSRKLERDELVRFTKQDASTERVNWTSGAAFVQVSTVERDDGFVRVQISTRFEGYGQSADRFAPPKGFWPLGSNTTLENQMISILARHFKNSS